MVVLNKVETLVVEMALIMVVDSIGVAMEDEIEVIFMVKETKMVFKQGHLRTLAIRMRNQYANYVVK